MKEKWDSGDESAAEEDIEIWTGFSMSAGLTIRLLITLSVGWSLSLRHSRKDYQALQYSDTHQSEAPTHTHVRVPQTGTNERKTIPQHKL